MPEDAVEPPGDALGLSADAPGLPEDRRPVFTWPTALLPGLALAGLLVGSAVGSTSAADDRPAGRTVVELEVTDR